MTPPENSLSPVTLSAEGLIKTYVKPFTPENHDALNENDYVWTRFIGNEILPVEVASR